MYGFKKRGFIIASVIIMTLSGIAGCGKDAEDADSSGIVPIEGEDLDEVNQAGGKDANGNADAANANQSNKDASNGDTSSADVLGTDAEGDSANHFHYINEGKDLYGDICEVGDMQFTVTEIYMETGDNGAEIMTSTAPEVAGEAPKITVVYDENTKFVKQKIWDGGANHEEKEGSAADLKKGFTAEMNGSYEGDVFHAAAILIVEVILD